MKKILTASLVMMIFTLIAVLMIGCGEEEVPERSATDLLGTMKMPETVAAAPQAPNVGFHIKEVGYYADWRLTKPLSGTVKPGTTVFTKVVFSEPVQFKAADDDSARPILYYRIDTERIRYRIAKHGAGGEDFVSGDAKPWDSGTDDYICKFTIPEDATDRFRIEIGKLNTNKDGVTLPVFYAHKEQLHIGLPEEPVVSPKAEDPEPVTVDPLTVVSITHYRDGSNEPIPEGASVDAGTTITTEIVFSESVRANSVVISYPFNLSTKNFYQSTGVHWRGSYQISTDGTTVRSKLIASEEVFSLTVERAASLDGNVLKQAVTVPELQVVPRVVSVVPVPPWEPATSEPEEVIVPIPQKPVLPEPQEPIPQMSVIPDNVEKKAMRIAKKVSSARAKVAAKGSRERYVNFSEDWSMALDVIADEERVPELSRDLILDLYYIYLDNSPHPMVDYVSKNKRYAPSLVLAYFRLRFLNPRSTQEAILEMFKADVRNGTIKVFLM